MCSSKYTCMIRLRIVFGGPYGVRETMVDLRTKRGPLDKSRSPIVPNQLTRFLGDVARILTCFEELSKDYYYLYIINVVRITCLKNYIYIYIINVVEYITYKYIKNRKIYLSSVFGTS